MADDICSKSNFASFRNVRLRIKIHEPRYIQGEEMMRWGWLLCIILVVVWGARLPSIENERGGDGLAFPGYFIISGCFDDNASSDRRSKARWGCGTVPPDYYYVVRMLPTPRRTRAVLSSTPTKLRKQNATSKDSGAR